MVLIAKRGKIYTDAREYVDETYDYEARVAFFYRIIYYTINVFNALLTLMAGILTTLVISRMIWPSFPNWYFFVTAAGAALTTFTTSLLNFFIVRTTILDNDSKAVKIQTQLIDYNLQLNKYKDPNTRDLILFEEIYAIRFDTLFVEELQRRLKNDVWDTSEKIVRRDQENLKTPRK